LLSVADVVDDGGVDAAALALIAAVKGVWLFQTVAGEAGAGVEDGGGPGKTYPLSK
jgi:hypothetical protein